MHNYYSTGRKTQFIWHNPRYDFSHFYHLITNDIRNLTSHPKALVLSCLGVCNSLETLLVHQDIATEFLPQVARAFAADRVKVHGCTRSLDFFDNAVEATEADWDAEYLALEIAIKVVNDYEQAVSHIQQHSSGHTEVIVTQDISTSQRFTKQINSAVVMTNASSRFSDGGELGLGAEIGISTSKLHAYGPMGVESLTTEKFIVIGDGQIRE